MHLNVFIKDFLLAPSGTPLDYSLDTPQQLKKKANKLILVDVMLSMLTIPN